MTQILETLFKAADGHASDTGESDHAIGDLQDILREAWKQLSASQRLNIIRSDAVSGVLAASGLVDISSSSLEKEFNDELNAKEVEIAKSGYLLHEEENGFFWETDEEEGATFPTIMDAIESGYKHLLQTRKPKMRP